MYKDLFDRGDEVLFEVTAGNVRWLIVIQLVWAVTPFAMITFFAGLQTLPGERVEAAQIDGAGFWRQLWHVTLPHLRTLILFVALISIMDMYRVYDQVFVWTGNRFTDAHTLAVYNVRTATAFDIGRVGKGNAMSILTVIGIFVVLIPFLYRSYKDQIEERN